ncbi:hypothetical protein ACTXT7_006157 [Hymenolepis weldensis]
MSYLLLVRQMRAEGNDLRNKPEFEKKTVTQGVKTNDECSVLSRASDANAPNQVKGKGQALRKRGVSCAKKSGSCTRELLDDCSSKN